jgi:DNA-binding MarR family transcriptional regulator
MSSRALNRLYDDALRPTGLKSSQVPLLAAMHAGEFESISDLSRKLEMDRTTLTRNLRPLIAAGFVTLSTARGRAKGVQITREGLDALSRATPLWMSAQRHILSHFGLERWQRFEAELRALTSLT